MSDRIYTPVNPNAIPEMMFAPVHEEERCRRRVYLPEGKWYDYDYGSEILMISTTVLSIVLSAG